jgi:hypothetical protein
MIRSQQGWTGGANLLSEAGVVKLRLGQLGREDGGEGGKLTPTVITVTTLWEADTERDGTLVQDEVDIASGVPSSVDTVVAATVSAERLGSLDDFHIQTRAKALHVGDDVGAVAKDVGGREESCELLEAKRGENGGFS